MRKITLLLGITLLSAHDLPAQGAKAAARAFLTAQSDRQWPAMAALVDTSSLRALRRTAENLEASFAAVQRPEVRARIDSLRPPGMTQALEGIQSMLGPGAMLKFMFARVTDGEELRRLSNEELMARWFEAKSFGYMMDLTTAGPMKTMMEGNRGLGGMQREMERMRTTPLLWDVVGETAEGDSVAHVVFRVAGDGGAAPTGVITFRRTGGRWLIHFTNPDDQLAQLGVMAMRALQARFER